MKKFENQKKSLIEEKERLIKELNSIGYEMESFQDWIIKKENGEEEPDPNDEASITEEMEKKLAELNVLESEYHKVENALRRIEQGTYGICKICKKEIEEDRLKAYPAADICKEDIKKEN